MRNAVITLLEGMGIKHDTFQSGTTFKQSSLQSQPCVSEMAMPDDYTHTHTQTHQLVCLVTNLVPVYCFIKCITRTNNLKERNAPSSDRGAPEK
jgi:tRNA uridine 5-carbamoylmethylation protein Kti12